MTIKFALALTGIACLLARPASADVAGLESLQAANANLQYHYTFEGTYDPVDGTGTWLEQKGASGTPDLVQTLFEPNRIADQITPGYDASSNAVDFLGWASGIKGDGLTSNANINYATSGTIEYLVQIGRMDDSSHFMIAGDGTGPNDRWRFFIAYGTDLVDPNGISIDSVSMTVGTNTPHEIIGGATSVPYIEEDWYYVVQNWSIAASAVTLDAWVANLSAGDTSLTQTVSGASNTFDGNGNTALDLGNLVNLSNFFADGGLDALAIYDAQLDLNTIQSHFDELRVVASADFDGDGDVDGADFIKWQRGGSPNPLSSSDLSLWKQQFGSSAALGAGAAVPEPTSLVLATLPMLVWLGNAVRWRRRSVL